MQSPLWSTVSIRNGADTVPLDLSALGAHIRRCNGAKGRWHGLQCVGDAAHGFLAPRFVTTLGLAAIGVALVSTLH